MKHRLLTAWSRMMGTLWFMPSVIVLGAVVLAVALVRVSEGVNREVLLHFPRLFGATAESSRSMLATIAGSMITVAGVTFSIMMVAVSQASSQFTPRVLRNFMRDRPSQVALGVLIGVFVYCLVVLRTIRGKDELEFIPSVAVLAAVALALIAVGFLVFFIHHIASTLDVSSIIAAVRRETNTAIDRLFPEPLAKGTSAEHDHGDGGEDPSSWHAVKARHTGYIQSVEAEGLLKLACEHETVIRMERGIGEFVIEGTALAVTSSGTDEAFERQLNRLYVLDDYRNVYQDAAFGIRQLVDIALKALSPGVNDVTTAAFCIDQLTATLVRLVRRDTPGSRRYVDGTLRVIARGPTFEQLLDDAFDEIRQSAADNPRIVGCLLNALETIGTNTESAARRAPLIEQLRALRAGLQRESPTSDERATLSSECTRVLRTLQGPR